MVLHTYVGVSGPSLLIEPTDSIIMEHYVLHIQGERLIFLPWPV